MQPKVLIITAHPSSHGFTHRIADAFAQGARESGKDVEIIDLYKTNLRQDFYAYEEKSDMMKADPVKNAIQQKIQEANPHEFLVQVVLLECLAEVFVPQQSSTD
mgnify:CR=1 FL=1